MVEGQGQILRLGPMHKKAPPRFIFPCCWPWWELVYFSNHQALSARARGVGAYAHCTLRCTELCKSSFVINIRSIFTFLFNMSQYARTSPAFFGLPPPQLEIARFSCARGPKAELFRPRLFLHGRLIADFLMLAWWPKS